MDGHVRSHRGTPAHSLAVCSEGGERAQAAWGGGASEGDLGLQTEKKGDALAADDFPVGTSRSGSHWLGSGFHEAPIPGRTPPLYSCVGFLSLCL